MGVFCRLALRSYTPTRDNLRAKTAKVSGRMPEYSRFRETANGDWVRSALRGPACSATRQILRLGRRQIGMPSPHYRAAIRDSARLEISIPCSGRWIDASRTAQPARRCHADILNLAPTKAENLADLTATWATQCRSNPVSGRGLPKTGVFQMSAGDYRLFRSESAENRSLETGG